MANRADPALGAAAMVLGAALIFWIIPAATHPALFALVSPQFYPLLAAWFLVAAGAGLAVSGLGSAAAREFPRRCAAVALLAAAGLGLAVVLMLSIGFIAAGAAVVLAVMLLAGERRIPFLIGLSAIFPFLLWLLFDVLLDRPLP